MIGQCSSLLPVAGKNTVTQSKPGGNWLMGYSPSSGEAKAGARGWSLKEKPDRNTAYIPLLPGLRDLCAQFSPPCLGTAPTAMGWVSNIN